MNENGKCPHCEVESWGSFLCDECRQAQADKMVVEEILITDSQFEELKEYYSGDTLMNNKVRGVFKHEGRLFINHGGGHDYCSCGEIVPLDQHDEPAIPYDLLTKFNGSGGFFHGNNQLVEWRGDQYVQIPYRQYKFKIGIRQATMF